MSHAARHPDLQGNGIEARTLRWLCPALGTAVTADGKQMCHQAGSSKQSPMPALYKAQEEHRGTAMGWL